MAFTLNRHKSEELLRAVDPDVTGADLVSLASSRDNAVKAALAARLDCPMASMFSLAQENDQKILEALARNPSAPRGVVVHLAQNRRPQVRDLALKRLEDAGETAPEAG